MAKNVPQTKTVQEPLDPGFSNAGSRPQMGSRGIFSRVAAELGGRGVAVVASNVRSSLGLYNTVLMTSFFHSQISVGRVARFFTNVSLGSPKINSENPRLSDFTQIGTHPHLLSLPGQWSCTALSIDRRSAHYLGSVSIMDDTAYRNSLHPVDRDVHQKFFALVRGLWSLYFLKWHFN